VFRVVKVTRKVLEQQGLDSIRSDFCREFRLCVVLGDKDAVDV
jgi:hypothetical protein